MKKYARLFLLLIPLFLHGCALFAPVDSIGSWTLSDYQASIGNRIAENHLNTLQLLYRAYCIPTPQLDTITPAIWHDISFSATDLLNSQNLYRVTGRYKVTKTGNIFVTEYLLTTNATSMLTTLNYIATSDVQISCVSSNICGSLTTRYDVHPGMDLLSCSSINIQINWTSGQTVDLSFAGNLPIRYQDQKGNTYETSFYHSGKAISDPFRLSLDADSRLYENSLRIGRIEISYKSYWGALIEKSINLISNLNYNSSL